MMANKNTHTPYFTKLISLNLDCTNLLTEQRKKNSRFNFSAWVRDKIKEDFMTEDLLMKEKREYLNKAKELSVALKLLREKEESQ
jgi:hypothetical protein